MSTPAHLLGGQSNAVSTIGIQGASPHTAKETFLNYFFGGPNGGGQTGPPGPGDMQMRNSDSRMREQQNQQIQSRRGERRVENTGNQNGQRDRGLMPPPGYSDGRDILPDLGSRRGTMSRASGLESSAVYDMRSLGKHIDLVSICIDYKLKVVTCRSPIPA